MGLVSWLKGSRALHRAEHAAGPLVVGRDSSSGLDTFGSDQASAAGAVSKWPLTYPRINTAPSMRAVDYLDGTKVLAAVDTCLLGATYANQNKLARINRTTYATSQLVDFSVQTGYVSGMSVQAVFVVDQATVLVNIWKSGTNSVLYKVTTTDNWTTASCAVSCYVGADDPNAGGTCTAGGTNLELQLLSQHSICRRPSDGAIFMVEYQTQATATTVRGRLLKSVNNGSSWSVAWTLNGSGRQIRHFHTVAYNPYTGRIWIGTGDEDAYGGTYTNESWILDWDGTTALTDNAVPTNSSATRLLRGLANEAYRPVQFLFRPEGVYFWSDADPAGASSYLQTGVYRVAHDCSTAERMTQICNRDAMASGYFAFETNDGAMAFCCQTTGVSGNAARGAPLLTSLDGDTWAIAGTYNLISDGSTNYGGGTPYGWVYDAVDDLGYVSYSYAAGKSATTPSTDGQYKCAVFRVLANTPHDRSVPETIHPVYWYGTAGSSGNSGYSRAAAKATLAQLLQSDVVTHGGSIQCLDATYTLDQTNAVSSASWDNNAAKGYAHVTNPLEINWRGCVVTYNRTTSGYGITYAAGTQHLRIFAPDGLLIGDSVSSGSIGFVDASAAGASVEITLEQTPIYRLNPTSTPSFGALFYSWGGKVTLERSFVSFGGGSGVITYSLAAGGALTTRVVDSVVENVSRLAQHSTRTDDKEQIENSLVKTVLGTWGGGAFAGQVYGYRSALISPTPTGVSDRFWTGAGKPGTLTFNPFKECVLNCAIDPSITITNANVPESNVWPDTDAVSTKAYYAPTDPLGGDWRDPKFPAVGPRYRLPAIGWTV